MLVRRSLLAGVVVRKGRERSRELERIDGGRRERKGQEQEALRTRKSLKLRLKYFQKQELKMFLDWTGPM